MTQQQWPSQQTGSRRTTSRPAPGRRLKTDWLTSLVLVALSAALVLTIAWPVAAMVSDTFQQVTDLFPATR